MKIKVLLVVAALIFSSVLSGCQSTKEAQPAQTGKVFATDDYIRYFGAPSAGDKGTAYPFIIYFPSAKYPGKVVPFPFITFDEPSMPKVAVERLLAGMELGSYRGEFNASPNGSRLISFNIAKGTVTANFSKEMFAVADKKSERATARAIGLTLRQFKDVRQVKIDVDGSESPLTEIANLAVHTDVQPPSPPRLVSVTAMKDKGAKEVEEVDAFFDRPVNVQELKILSADGKPFAGELYHSVFDMAGVLKPKDGSQFKEGMPVKVRWKVIDKVGRAAEGEDTWQLQVRQHEE